MDVFSGLITVYALQQKFEQAIARCDEHLAARGEDPMVAAVILNLKANILLADSQLENAVTTYEQAILKNPSYVTPYLSLGKIYTAQARIQEAIQTYAGLIENRPDQASAHTLIGTLYENKGQFELAQTHYKTALEIDPDLIPALNNLAYLYAEQGIHLNQALDMARQARRQTQQAPAVMDTLGWVYFKKACLTALPWNLRPPLTLTRQTPCFSITWDGHAWNRGGPMMPETPLKRRYRLNQISRELNPPEKFWQTCKKTGSNHTRHPGTGSGDPARHP